MSAVRVRRGSGRLGDHHRPDQRAAGDCPPDLLAGPSVGHSHRGGQGHRCGVTSKILPFHTEGRTEGQAGGQGVGMVNWLPQRQRGQRGGQRVKNGLPPCPQGHPCMAKTTIQRGQRVKILKKSICGRDCQKTAVNAI